MGLFGTIGNVIKWVGKKIFGSSSSSSGGSSSGGSSSSSSYSYESDNKIKIAKIERQTKLDIANKDIERAEIERQTKLQLADKEMERVELMRDAQIEILQAQAISQAAIEKARAEGMKDLANHLISLQDKMLEIAEKRMTIIEKCSLPIIKEIETFYNEIGDKIQADNSEYNTTKLPQLLQILNQYEKDSPAFQLYFAQVQNDMARQGRFIEQQLQQVSERQNLVLQSFLSSKEKILEQTGQITETIAQKFLSDKIQTLPQLQYDAQKSLSTQEFKALPSSV